MPVGMPGMPGGMPPFGNTSPAIMAGPKPGNNAKGEVIAGLALALLEMAIPMLGADRKIIAEEAHLKLLKEFSKPPQDLGQAELKFMGSQLYPQQRPPGAVMESGPGIQSQLQGLGVTPQAPPQEAAAAA